MDTENIFAFETDIAGTLPCIPMCVRYTLDEVGIKLSLKQWNRFEVPQRRRLVEMCDKPDLVAAFTQYLTELIASSAASHVEHVPAIASSQWSDAEHMPQRIIAHATSLGVSPPSLAQWASLSPLQRFALFKLTRPNHDNDNFIPAMREFGLLD